MMGTGRLKKDAPAPREYQEQMASSALAKGSTLVVLPTGLGKTLIAFLVAQEKLQSGPVLFCAPTKPLAAQHEAEARRLLDLDEGEIALITGEMPPAKRKAAYPQDGSEARLVFSTPQTIENDIGSGAIAWNFSLLVLDEVHRAVGKYAYARVAQEARKHGTAILGLTASPGGQKKKIVEMTTMLGISNVEIRTQDDADVAKYSMPLAMKFIEVQLTPKMEEAKDELRKMVGEKMNTMRRMGYPGKFASKKGLSEMRMKILASRSPLRFSALSQHATLFSLSHCLELLETQGMHTFLAFVDKMKNRDESKAQKRILGDARFVRIVERMKDAGEHPKLERLIALLKEKAAANGALKAIVFCQYRAQASLIAKKLAESGMRAQEFMGKKDGVTAQGQKDTLAAFRRGGFDIMVATSIGEEGLDIPSVDMVVFYEPVPSEIRSIQRRGRAGRAKTGEVYVLVTKGTQDQGFFFASKRREDSMRRIVGRMAGREYTGAKTGYEKVDEGKVGESPEKPQEKKKPAKKDAEKRTGAGQKQTRMSDYFS